MSEQSALPNLIVIGAMKCGTTSLHNYLDQHPEITMAEEKEINYFVPQYHSDKPVEWYTGHFDEHARYRGEASQNYSKRHLVNEVAASMHKLIPDVKLIYIIRNPVKRFLSHVHEAISQEYRDRNYDPNDDEDLEGSNFTLTGRYFYQLEPFLKYFQSDQVKIMLLEDLKDKPLQTMNDTFRWLGLKELNENQMFTDRKNTFAEKKIPNKLGQLLRKGNILSGVGKFLPSGVKSFINKTIDINSLTMTNFEPVQLHEETKSKLDGIFLPDLEKILDFVKGTEHNEISIPGIEIIIEDLKKSEKIEH